MRFLLCVLPIFGACIEQDLSQIKDAEPPDTADTDGTSIPGDPLTVLALSPDPVYTLDLLQASASQVSEITAAIAVLKEQMTALFSSVPNVQFTVYFGCGSLCQRLKRLKTVVHAGGRVCKRQQ